MNSNNPLTSIVICTHERHVSLQRTLESLLDLTYRQLEVVVVDSSSDEKTVDLINSIKSSYPFSLKIIISQQRNISISRNIGLRNACGEFIFFIDDDAVPPVDWIEKTLDIYSLYGENCAGVGGIVRDMTTTGYPFQYENGISNVMSNTINIRRQPAIDYNHIEGWWYNSLMGANSSYRSRCLKAVNGYDEFFEYFLDETDLCLRLIQSNYKIHYSNTIVDHYPQPSHNRKSQKYLTCWYSLAKNTTYFALKHALNRLPVQVFVFRLAGLLIYRCLLRILRLKLTHDLPTEVLRQYIDESLTGIKVGWKAGMKIHTIEANK
jgi:GT2 family glycosyltransferase